MKFTGSLLLTTLFLVVLTGYVTSLRAGGRNVLTRWVKYYTKMGRSRSLSTTNGRTCVKTCTWSCCNCRRCRTKYKTKWVTSYYAAVRYKPIYYCAPGWKDGGWGQSGCTIPICTAGCHNGGRCIRPERCQCSSGWQGSNCRTDKNECATNNGGCQHHCSNYGGGYRCYCDSGYRASGSSCTDINECTGSNNCQQICVNKIGSYSCACHTGYRRNSDLITCSDIDECAQSTCQYKCNNTVGSFFCTCPQGYLLTSNKRDCADHDECMTGKHTCQQRCVNHPGGYSCACQVGFTLKKDNQSCSDIDECKLGLAGCAHRCNNTIGSFQCLCPTGYFLNSDNRTCSDHDECKNGQHTCSQICGNTPGSYYCTCRPGYYLGGDLRTCKGYSCSSISQPAKGYMNCTGKTMDSVCQFSCQPGYELVGSLQRVCLVSGQWSGRRAFCKVKNCQKPTPPVNGYVKIPCSTTYKGKCSVRCSRGFFLNGSRTFSCSADSKWVPTPGHCDAITVCHPNPCNHGGVCNPINSTAFWCNCTKTAYTGNKCHTGIFRKPKYPRLQENSSLNITFELSPPEKELTVTPSATGVEFSPRNLVISPVQLEEGRLYRANMTMTARLPGIHLITYTLSGVAADSYQQVNPDTVIVLANGTSCKESLSTSLPVGCHRIKLLKCPHGDHFLLAKSTESWKRTQGKVSTKGIASVLSANNLTLPLGIRGAALDNLNPLHDVSISTDKEQCKAQSPIKVQCLPSEIVASVFLQSLNASFPSWFHLIPSKTLSNFETNDAVTYIWSGLQLKGVLKGLGLSVKEQSYYSTLLYTNALIVNVNKSSVALPKYNDKHVHLIATELCSKSWPNNVIIVFNPRSHEALQSLPVYQHLAARGWNVSAMAVQFSSRSALSQMVNTRNQSNELIFGSLELYGRVEKTMNGSRPIDSLGVRLTGNAIFQIPDINKVWVDRLNSWKAGLNGIVTINMTLILLKQKVSVQLQLDKSSGQVQYRDSPNSKSCKISDTYELFLNGYLQKDPFTSTLLGSFIESPNSKISFYANSHRLSSSSLKEPMRSAIQLGFNLTGIIRFGPLKFPNMSINTEIYSEEFKTCNGNSLSIQGLNLSATFNQQEALGRFFTSFSSDSIHIFLPSNSQSRTEGIINATVALLGDSFQAKVTISNTSLTFQREVNLFDNYRLFLNASGKLQPWDFLSLKVTGIFGKSNSNSDHNTLEDKVKEMIIDYIKVVEKNTFQRLKVLQSTSDKMKARIDGSKLRLVQVENITHLAVKRYLWALRAEKAAFKDVKRAEKKLSNSSQELNQIKASLESLCPVIECPYVCVTGTTCNTCYEDLISKEQGVCPATCHNVLKERLPPYWETVTCYKDHCKKTGVRNLFEGLFLQCTFDNVVKPVVKQAITIGATVALTSAGVPPTTAYATSSAAVNFAYTYDETQSEEEAIKAAAQSAAAGALTTGPSISGSAGQVGKEAAEGCDSEGEWKCHLDPFPCEREVFNYKFTNIPYSCEISCQVNVVKETIATPCCQEVNCASRIRDLKCKEKNAFCRIAREKAMSKLNAAKRDILKPLEELQQAKKVLNVAEIELAKRKLELEASSSERDTLRRAHDAIVKATNISERSNDENRALIQDAINLAQLWNSTNGTCPVDIKEISFDVTLSSPSETQIPVLFKIASATKEKNIFSIINFASLNDSLRQTAKQIVKALFGNVNVVLRSGHPLNQVSSTQGKGRRKRAIDERGSDVTTLVVLKKKCALVTNYQRALSDIIGTLYNISSESLQLLNNVRNHTSKPQHAEAHDFVINTTQAAELGLSNKDLDDSVNTVRDDEEVMKTASLVELSNATNHKKVQTAINMVFRDWEASMEAVFNCTSLECSGFIDCIEDFVDNLLYLYQGIDLPGAVRLQRQIAILSTEVKSLLSHEDLSVAEAAEKSSRILQMLKDIKDENVFCAVAPNITQNPVAKEDLKVGQTLELSCKATAKPAPSYRWRKNGVPLPGSNTENLRIEKVKTNDSGNYTCEAYNHVKVQLSTPSRIFVHAPPILVHQPSSDMNIPVNTGFYMRCNATSIAKPLRYQWLFMPINGDSYSLVPNGNFSVLSFNPVQKQEEGFYKCNVSNPFDYTLSHSVRLRVLGFSLVVPSLGLSFEIASDNRSLRKAYEERNKVQSGGNPLHVNENLQQDVELAFIRTVHNLVDLPSNAVQDLTIKDCEITDENNVSCNVSFRLRSFNMTGLESANRTEEENAVSVIDSVKQLESAATILVNESNARGIILNVRGVGLKVDAASWSFGEYISLCPIGKILYESNFVCVNCPPGTRGAMNGTSPACFPCPEGTYQPDQGQTSCVPCPAGSNSRRTGLEDLSSCKDLLPETTTSQTSQSPDVPTRSSLPSTFSLSTPKDPEIEEVTTNETNGPKALHLQSHNDVSKWKIAFGVCVAMIIILLAGVVFYAINYRAKRIGWFKTSPGDSNKKEETAKKHTFHNPVYDVDEGVQEEPVYGHDNQVYQITDDSDREEMKTQSDMDHTIHNPVCDVNTVVKQKPGYSHENPAYQMADDSDKEI